MMNVSSIFLAEFSKILLNSELKDKDLGVKVAFPRFHEDLIFKLLNETLQTLKNLPTVYDLKSDIYVVGDIHGNIRDLIRILRYINFMETDSKILFLGDYVDKGEFSIEVITLLFSLFLQFPDRIFMIRGNHEFDSVNVRYGFKFELTKEYKNDRLWERFNTVFNYLPIAAVIDGKYFCVHAAISPQIKNIDQLRSIQRPILSFRSNYILTDILWGDPDSNVFYYSTSERGYGHLFGPKAVDEFCEDMKIGKIIRSHKCVDNGVEAVFSEKVITVFSCSNYCDTCNNKAGILHISGEKVEEVRFDPLEILVRSKALFKSCVKSS